MDPMPQHPSKPDGGRSRLDRVLDAVKHRRCRHLLYYLRDTDSADIEEAARRIAAREHGADPDDVSNDQYEHVLTSLHHRHLPRLADLGVVEYDRRSGDVRLYDPPEDLDALLELTRSLDDEVDRD